MARRGSADFALMPFDVPDSGKSSVLGANTSERAYVAIERLLVTGQIAPRSIINEVEICKTLGLGRTPVRLALQRLADHGLVEIVPRRGIFVTDVDFEGQMLILEARRELDRLLCQSAHLNAAEADRVALRKMSAKVIKARDRRDFATLLETDLQFKQLTLRLARNPFLTGAIVPIHALSRRFYFMNTVKSDPEVDLVLAKLMETVADGDENAVEIASDRLIDELERFARQTILAKLGIKPK
jgi:DNA-binding GntR family transcriptional regulator